MTATPRDLVEAVRRGGFDFYIDGDRARLRPVAKTPAIGRELVEELRDRRAEVLDYLREFDLPGDARPDAVTTDPKPLPTPAPPKSEWETCATCRADVLAAEMPTAMALCDAPSKCPYRPAEATPAASYERPSAPSSPSGPARPLIGSRPAPPPAPPDLFAG